MTKSFCVVACIWTVSYAAFMDNTKPFRLPVEGQNLINASQSVSSGGWSLVPWISNSYKLGQVSGISVDKYENIHIFHRGSRVWNMNSFGSDNVFQEQSRPISENTILVFDPKGTLLHQWGSGMFHMPHGITVDSELNVWITDVALHQVMKFHPYSNSSSFVLGEAFVPGTDSQHFCKPTSVAVVSNGDFFVADGYCNSRILKFNKEGIKILEWGRSTLTGFRIPGKYELQIPHSLTLLEENNLVCVADRENGRVVCYHINNGSYVQQFDSTKMGSRLFSVAYSPVKGGKLFIVNGPDPFSHNHVQGFVVSLSGEITDNFGTNLEQPHCIALSNDGSTIYVGEIGPNKAWKYVNSNGSFAPVPISTEKKQPSLDSYESSDAGGLAGAIIVTVACFIFAAVILVSVLIYSRSRKFHSSDSKHLLSSQEL